MTTYKNLKYWELADNIMILPVLNVLLNLKFYGMKVDKDLIKYDFENIIYWN